MTTARVAAAHSSAVDILVVDDDPKTLKALEATLAELGQNIVTARSGTEALLRTIDRDFALILLDVQMPELDGFETASLLRNRERSRSIPIIFLTAFNQNDSAVFRGYQVGAVDFLFKPIVPEVLKSKVAVFVELSRKTDEVRRQAELIREAEQREAERRLLIAKQQWEAEALREQMENQRRLAMELEQHNARLALVSETATLLLVGTDARAVIHAVFERLARHLDLEVLIHHAVTDDRDPEYDVLVLHTSLGVPEELLAGQRRIRFGNEVSGVAAARRERVVVEQLAGLDDASQHPFLRAIGLASYVCFPLLSEGRLIGTIAFGSRTRASFDERTLSLMQVIVDQVAMRVDRARLIAELEERDRRKDEFLAMLSHELRNPLSPVMSAVHLLGRHVAHVPAIESTRQLIRRQLTHLVRLVDDLLDVSRITQGKIELQREEVALGEIIEQAVQLAEPNIAARQHTLEVEVHAAETELFVDATRLTQVAANLLNNAARYTPIGGRIRIATRAADEGPTVEIVVSDNGIGLTAEAIARIFDLFVQGDHPSDRAHGGLGIGLTLAKRLMELHGGDVIAASDGPNRGSTFTVRIPAICAQACATELAAATGGQPPLRIVVIEDNIDVRDTVVELLRLEGHEVHAAEDGARGIALVTAHTPDVALVDVGLPGRDGYTVARELDELRRARRLPLRLIAMTGYGRAEDRRRAVEAGFDHHLVKPVEPEILLAALTAPRPNDDEREI